jgi:hypothetical protein
LLAFFYSDIKGGFLLGFPFVGATLAVALFKYTLAVALFKYTLAVAQNRLNTLAIAQKT